MGGLGVADLNILNIALLAKIMHQWLQPNRPAWMAIVQLTNQTVRPWEVTNRTPFWANLTKIGPLMQISVLFDMGKGTHIRFWQDNWGRQKLMDRYPELYSYAVQQNASIAQNINQRSWQIAVHSTMSQMAADQLQRMQTELPTIIGSAEEDRLTWRWTASGLFTVKSAYSFMIEGSYTDTGLQNIWTVGAPTRVMVFAWLMLQNRILTIDNLVKRGWEMVNRCCMCKANSETVKHLFSQCQYTRMLKMELISRIPELIRCRYFNAGDYKQAMLRSKFKKVKQVQMTMAFVLWRERCKRTFTEQHQTISQVAQEIQSEIANWFQEQ